MESGELRGNQQPAVAETTSNFKGGSAKLRDTLVSECDKQRNFGGQQGSQWAKIK